MSTTREQIAEVFGRHVESFGYAKTNLDDVSSEMHISKKTIYAHFGGKRDIYGYIVGRQADVERGRMKAQVASLPTCAAKVEMLLGFVIASARSHINETSQGEWLQEYEVAADAFRQAHGDLLRELVAEGIESGDFAAGDPDLVEQMVGAMALEYLLLVNADPSYDRDAELVERILRFIG
jgi:AcrR family transcriptional regulator